MIERWLFISLSTALFVSACSPGSVVSSQIAEQVPLQSEALPSATASSLARVDLESECGWERSETAA
jgi:hypothetical protein